MKIYSKRKFPTLGSCSIGPDSSYSYIEEITSDKLLGLTLDNHLVWVNQIDKTYIEDITPRRRVISSIFEWWKQYFTNERSCASS
jgi:hypothetical protein